MDINKNTKRVGILDELRGFAILCMVFYHLMYDLNFIYDIDIPIMFDGWFNYVRDIFAGLFIFISGISCRYSRNNMKRGIQCFFIGMAITFIFAVMGQMPINFGILHCLGICMMIYGVWEKYINKIPTKVGILSCIIIFLSTYGIKSGYLGLGQGMGIRLPRNLYDAQLLFPLGFKDGSYEALDYFPLLPWLFLMLCGAFVGDYFIKNKMPKFFYKNHCKPLAAVGRYTLWIYILHQPIAMGILLLIFGR